MLSKLLMNESTIGNPLETFSKDMESVIDKCVLNGHQLFKIKWKNIPLEKSTWEYLPLGTEYTDDLINSLVKEYEDNNEQF